MKLGELCEIVIEPMQVEPEGYDAFLVDGVSFQQKNTSVQYLFFLGY